MSRHLPLGEQRRLWEKGVVYLLELGDVHAPDSPPVVGYWEAEVRDELAILAEGPGWQSLDDALLWAVERSALILATKADGEVVLYDVADVQP